VCAVEDQPVCGFARVCVRKRLAPAVKFHFVPPSGDPAHFQPRRLLRFQDRARAKSIAAVKRQRMIKNVENPSHGPVH